MVRSRKSPLIALEWTIICDDSSDSSIEEEDMDEEEGRRVSSSPISCLNLRNIGYNLMGNVNDLTKANIHDDMRNLKEMYRGVFFYY